MLRQPVPQWSSLVPQKPNLEQQPVAHFLVALHSGAAVVRTAKRKKERRVKRSVVERIVTASWAELLVLADQRLKE